ncbi:MAG: hypothetical protein PVF34_01580 [Gammaproteobacteria bacterium]|jgi:hypothetical protein
MSTKDKTREKLVNSMRKTKAVINEQSDSKQEHAETYAPPPARPPKTAKSAKNTQSEEATEISSTRPAIDGDPYQSRGRIWPD